jgi:multidrug efflux pump subunit AcrA (membrane-fusion protein)
VQQGQVLAVLEDRDLTASAQESEQLYREAEANYRSTVSATMPDELIKAKTDVDSARQVLDAAEKVYKSRQELLHEGALSVRLVEDARVSAVQARSQFETARQHLQSLESSGRNAQMESARAQVQAAKAHYEAAAAQLGYAEVRSPISGVVADRPANVGEVANGGSPLISVVDVSRVIARATVPVQEAQAIRRGSPAKIIAGRVVLPGKVTVVSPAVDPNTTTVQVWTEAKNPGDKVKLGMTVQVEIDAGEVRKALVIPATALLASDEGGEKVMVAGPDSLAHEHDVKIGIRSGDDVQILEGIETGDQVITEGALGLDDKAKVEIIRAGTAKPGAEKGAADKK